MKRRVLMFHKRDRTPIPGISASGHTAVYVGQACPPGVLDGAGTIGEMEFTGSAIVIRKRYDDGKPCRNFGQLSLSQPGQKPITFEADGLMIPIADVRAVLFEDVEEKPQRQPEQKPAEELAKQAQQGQQRR